LFTFETVLQESQLLTADFSCHISEKAPHYVTGGCDGLLYRSEGNT